MVHTLLATAQPHGVYHGNKEEFNGARQEETSDNRATQTSPEWVGQTNRDQSDNGEQ